MRSRVWPLGVIGLCWAYGVARALRVWDRLPPVLASHFGPSGVANGWMSRRSYFLFDLVVIGGITLLLVLLPLGLAFVPPQMMNLPNRDYWLAGERRQETLDRIARWAAWFAVAVNLLFLVVNELALRANLRHRPIESTAISISLGAFLAFVAGWIGLFAVSFRVPRPASRH